MQNIGREYNAMMDLLKFESNKEMLNIITLFKITLSITYT